MKDSLSLRAHTAKSIPNPNRTPHLTVRRIVGRKLHKQKRGFSIADLERTGIIGVGGYVAGDRVDGEGCGSSDTDEVERVVISAETRYVVDFCVPSCGGAAQSLDLEGGVGTCWDYGCEGCGGEGCEGCGLEEWVSLLCEECRTREWYIGREKMSTYQIQCIGDWNGSYCEVSSDCGCRCSAFVSGSLCEALKKD